MDLLDQLKPSQRKLLEEALSIEAEDAKRAGTIGYMARVLAQVTMPHSKPSSNEFVRKNGDLTLSIISPSKIGLPYGTLPRLLLSWVTTEAVRTKSPQIVLGETLSEFMSELQITPTGGRWGSIPRLRDQMKRLFASTIHCMYDGTLAGKRGFASAKIDIAEDLQLWWDPKSPDQAGLWQSEVILTKRFFEEITSSPVPIDMRALKALRKSPMALDLYIWLTHRMSYLSETRVIPWDALRLQFGAEYAGDRFGKANFKRKLKEQLKKVQVVYPEVRVDDQEAGLLLKPSKPHVAKLSR